MNHKGTRASATLIGSLAILLWSSLALFTSQSAGIPPFQLLAMCFVIAFVASIIFQLKNLRNVFKSYIQPVNVWILNVAGLFGYHFFYFVALANAPPVQAGLIAYLWPLLIVVFSALLPGERLRWFHVVGSIVSLLGAVLIVTGGVGVELTSNNTKGYLAALICALVWSSYSIINRKFSSVPSTAVGGFCVVVAVLATFSHLLFEQTVNLNLEQWIAVVCLGLGPLGLAFFVWDFGVKHGHIQLLGVLAYSAPLLSTLLLLAFDDVQWHYNILIACMLVVIGALIASSDLIRGMAKENV